MIWGLISYYGMIALEFIEERINADFYISSILEPHLDDLKEKIDAF